MKKIIFILLAFFIYELPIIGQFKNYNCIVFDSLISTIKLKKMQNDFLFPLLKSGEICRKKDSIYILTTDELKVKKIKSVLSTNSNIDGNLEIDDVLFSLDTFNIVIDTFGYFDNSCSNKNFLVVNNYNILNSLKETCNVIIVEALSYNVNGSFKIFLRSNKSDFIIVFRFKSSSLYPSISVECKELFDILKR